MKSKTNSINFKSYIFSEPAAEIHFYSNALIKGKKIYLPRSVRAARNLPTMYVSWLSKQSAHLKFRFRFPRIRKFPYINKTLLVFDTWGTSSYYHLLIDHVIPVWITREWFKDELNIDYKEFEYFRVSNNHYSTEISSSTEIFAHFLGKPFHDKISGRFEKLIYGYLYSYRPFHGPNSERKLYPEYSVYLHKFRKTFLKDNEVKSSKLILVPKRYNRDFDFVNDFVERYKDEFNFIHVDFSEKSIQEQIDICSSAKIIFGSEGAAFANQVFMPNGSLIIPVSNQIDRFDFHAPLAAYLNFIFSPILLDEFGKPVTPEREILETLRKFLAKG